MLVGGYSQDVSHVPIQSADLPKPAVTASDVRDRETLIASVEEAARTYRKTVMSAGYSGLTRVRNAFRTEGGHWKSGSIYLVGRERRKRHPVSRIGALPRRQATDMVRTDSKGGGKIAEELIGGARREGRKFPRFHYDNPANQGDEETGSPKLGYAVSFPVPNTDQRGVIGSGIYVKADGG